MVLPIRFQLPLFLLSSLLLLGGIALWKKTSSATAPVGPQSREIESVHHHAGFQVYLDGKLQDYSEYRFMHIEPCTLIESETPLTPLEEQNLKAHLHDSVGDVVHVHRAGATWGDLFKNLGVTFPDQTIIAYQPEPTEDILNQVIQPDSSIIIVIGDQSSASAYLEKRVTQERIDEVEDLSESCGGE